jgi:hypothetical protein
MRAFPADIQSRAKCPNRKKACVACRNFPGGFSTQSAFRRILSAFARSNAYILFNGSQWPDIGDEMNTTYTTRFAGLMVAMLMTLVVNGGMLWSFDNASKDETLAQDKVFVTLETVTIVAQRS